MQHATEHDGIAELFTPMGRDFAQNPYPVYAKLQALEQPYFHEPMGIWMLSRFADVEQAARNSTLVRSLDAFMRPVEVEQVRRAMNWHDMPNHSRFVQSSMLDSDGEAHRRLRMLVMREFSRGFVAHHRGMIQKYVDKLLDTLIETRHIDFIADLAAHVPGHIIGNILGVADEDCAQLRKWSEDVVQFFDVDRNDTHKQMAERATTEFYHFLTDLIALRTKQPKEDLISSLIGAKRAGEISETELISTCMLILMAGHGSTIDVLGTGMYNLLRHPDQAKQLGSNPSIISTAVQEMFRFESPLPFFHRYATEPITVMGQEYPVGTKFGLLYGAANRDSRVFDQADKFDITRLPNRHVAFGRGAHLCLGNNLSRLDMEIIFHTLWQRVASIELMDSEPTYKQGLSVRGLVNLQVSLQAK